MKWNCTIFDPSVHNLWLANTTTLHTFYTPCISLLLIRAVCDVADAHFIVIKTKLLSSCPKLNFHILWNGIHGRFITTTHNASTSIWTSGSVSTIYVEHPIGVGPGEDPPLLHLRPERRISIPVGHHTRLSQRYVGHGEDHRSRAGVVRTTAVRDVVNPASSFHYELIALAREVVEASRPTLLAEVQPSQDPPLSLRLSHISEIPYCVRVVGQAVSVRRRLWKAAVIAHALH